MMNTNGASSAYSQQSEARKAYLRAYYRQYRKDHPAYVTAKNQRWREQHPDYARDYCRTRRAKARIAAQLGEQTGEAQP